MSAPIPTRLPDGLYAVIKDDHPCFVAGFIVSEGKIRKADCAPIIRNRLSYWITRARKVSTTSRGRRDGHAE